MNGVAAAGISVVLLAGAVASIAGREQGVAPAATGTWIVAVAGRPERLPLELRVSGAQITGTLNGSPVEGEVKDGQLTFTSPADWAAWRAGTIGSDGSRNMYPTVIVARLDQAGSLSGRFDVFIRGSGPQPIKRMDWTAVRVTGR